jgi:hypothetical protein
MADAFVNAARPSQRDRVAIRWARAVLTRPATMKLAYLAPVLLVGCATEMTEVDDGFRAGSKADDPSGWSHVVLGSDTGIGISVDYVSHFVPDNTSYKPTHVDYADPVYANVWGDQLTGEEEVRVVLMNYERCEKRAVPFTYTVDLAWQGDHFSANVSRDAQIDRSYLHWQPGTVQLTTRWSGYGGNHPFCQEIAVVVDGTWLVDPISRGNNFSFDLYAAR